jgi:hypothetical protein
LPLIVCTTTDVINVGTVLGFLGGHTFQPAKLVGNAVTGDFIYSIGVAGLNYVDVLHKNVERERTLVVVNPDEHIPEAFDAGPVPVPDEMVQKLLQDLHVTPTNLAEVAVAVHGLTLKEISEVATLAAVAEGALTGKAVRKLRDQIAGRVPGVQVVDTAMPMYMPNKGINRYIQLIGRLLPTDLDVRLRPRGVLLSGIPGTGKTMGAKHIAASLKVPLLRLDLGALMSKYVGESEQNLRRAIHHVESMAPCVMLIDEIEKLFTGSDDSGVTQNLLAALLWWLQEHDSKVLTVMTTNDTDALPKELIRAGRIDSVLKLPDKVGDVQQFVAALFKSLGYTNPPVKIPEELSVSTPANLTRWVINEIRRTI